MSNDGFGDELLDTRLAAPEGALDAAQLVAAHELDGAAVEQRARLFARYRLRRVGLRRGTRAHLLEPLRVHGAAVCLRRHE